MKKLLTSLATITLIGGSVTSATAYIKAPQNYNQMPNQSTANETAQDIVNKLNGKTIHLDFTSWKGQKIDDNLPLFRDEIVAQGILTKDEAQYITNTDILNVINKPYIYINNIVIGVTKDGSHASTNNKGRLSIDGEAEYIAAVLSGKTINLDPNFWYGKDLDSHGKEFKDAIVSQGILTRYEAQYLQIYGKAYLVMRIHVFTGCSFTVTKDGKSYVAKNVTINVGWRNNSSWKIYKFNNILYVNDPQKGLYDSTDEGKTWTLIYGITPQKYKIDWVKQYGHYPNGKTVVFFQVSDSSAKDGSTLHYINPISGECETLNSDGGPVWGTVYGQSFLVAFENYTNTFLVYVNYPVGSRRILSSSVTDPTSSLQWADFTYDYPPGPNSANQLVYSQYIGEWILFWGAGIAQTLGFYYSSQNRWDYTTSYNVTKFWEVNWDGDFYDFLGCYYKAGSYYGGLYQADRYSWSGSGYYPWAAGWTENYGVPVTSRINQMLTWNGGIFVLTNQGTYIYSGSWAQWAFPGAVKNDPMAWMKVINNNAYIDVPGVGLYRASDIGLDPVFIPPQGVSINSIEEEQGFIFLSTTEGLYKSTDNGQDFYKVNGLNVTDPGFNKDNITSTANEFWVTTSNGLYESSFGDVWTQVKF